MLYRVARTNAINDGTHYLVLHKLRHVLILIIVQPEVMFVTAFRNRVCCILGVFYRSTAEQSHWFDGCLLLLLFACKCHLHL